MATTKKAAKSVLILRRYFIKKDYPKMGLHRADVVLVVRNGEGKEYTVTLRRNGIHSCSCAAGSHGQAKCYHRDHCKLVENARIEARKAAKVAQPVVSKPVQAVASPVVAEESYTMSSALLAKLAGETAKDNVVDIAERGVLNSSQQSASFWLALPSRQIA